MKFTKFLPLTVAVMMMATPAFANDGSGTATANFDLNIPTYVNIVKDPSSNENATATISNNYTTLQFDKDLVAKFNVVTNAPSTHIQLTGKSTETGGEKTALYGTDAANMKLVFAQETAAAGTIQNTITNGENSPNAIAFNLGFVGTHSGAATADPVGVTDAVGEGGAKLINYTIDNGEYTFTYTVTGAGIADNSFDTKDTAGHYKAKLTLSYVTP